MRLLALLACALALVLVPAPAAADVQVHLEAPVAEGVVHAEECHGNGPVDNAMCLLFAVLPERGRSGGRVPWWP